MASLVFYLLVFLTVGSVFLFVHMLIGKFIRPFKPEGEKLTIYECGEPTVGSAWIQFDLRYYVVALLFVVFDVEVAFFFPWAVVFGKANEVARVLESKAAVETQLANLYDEAIRYAPNAEAAKKLRDEQAIEIAKPEADQRVLYYDKVLGSNLPAR